MRKIQEEGELKQKRKKTGDKDGNRQVGYKKKNEEERKRDGNRVETKRSKR